MDTTGCRLESSQLKAIPSDDLDPSATGPSACPSLDKVKRRSAGQSQSTLTPEELLHSTSLLDQPVPRSGLSHPQHKLVVNSNADDQKFQWKKMEKIIKSHQNGKQSWLAPN